MKSEKSVIDPFSDYMRKISRKELLSERELAKVGNDLLRTRNDVRQTILNSPLALTIVTGFLEERENTLLAEKSILERFEKKELEDAVPVSKALHEFYSYTKQSLCYAIKKTGNCKPEPAAALRAAQLFPVRIQELASIIQTLEGDHPEAIIDQGWMNVVRTELEVQQDSAQDVPTRSFAIELSTRLHSAKKILSRAEEVLQTFHNRRTLHNWSTTLALLTETLRKKAEPLPDINHSGLRNVGRQATDRIERELQKAFWLLKMLTMNRGSCELDQYRKNGREALDAYTEAKNTLIENNLRTVVAFVRKFFGRGLDMDDCIQEGNLLLTHALDVYDPRKGAISSYIRAGVQESVRRALHSQTHLVTPPYGSTEDIVPLMQAFHEQREQGRRPSVERIYETAKNSDERKKIARLFDAANALRKHKSLEQFILDQEYPTKPYAEEDSDNPIDPAHMNEWIMVRDTIPAPTIKVNIESQQLSEDVRLVLKTLNQREREVIRMYYGFDDEPMTLQEISMYFGVGTEAIRQIMQKGIRKLQHPIRARLLEQHW